MAPYTEEARRKSKVRKRGSNLLRKSRELGEMTDIPTLTLYECPTHNEWRLGAHLPKGRKFPDVNRLVCDSISFEKSATGD